jgi:putative mRNA 3-end processing factor
MEFQFLGGATEVGRLGMVFRRGGTSLLFDYGVLPKDPPVYPLPAPPVDTVFITHSHLDHIGMLPWVCSRQDVDVVAAPPTFDVGDLLLEDSIKIADLEGYASPYTERELRHARRFYRGVDHRETLEVEGLEVTLHPAGHIPGATMFEVNAEKTVLFSGDLHTLTTDLVWGAQPVRCDVLVLESTYAGRTHPDREKSTYAFLKKVDEVVSRGGLAVVPAFAVGRTQDVLLALAQRRFEVWLDGMGKEVNSIYTDHPEYLRSVKRLRTAMHRVRPVRNPNHRRQAVKGEVIVTTSGMLDGGPVVTYMQQIRDDPRSAVLLTGFQVPGTQGRRLLEEGVISLDGEDVRPKFELQKFDFSAHAGHDELVRFVERCDPETVVLMHGDNREALASALPGRRVILPREGEWFDPR